MLCLHLQDRWLPLEVNAIHCRVLFGEFVGSTLNPISQVEGIFLVVQKRADKGARRAMASRFKRNHEWKILTNILYNVNAQ
jgi:hypothetical protein